MVVVAKCWRVPLSLDQVEIERQSPNKELHSWSNTSVTPFSVRHALGYFLGNPGVNSPLQTVKFSWLAALSLEVAGLSGQAKHPPPLAYGHCHPHSAPQPSTDPACIYVNPRAPNHKQYGPGEVSADFSISGHNSDGPLRNKFKLFHDHNEVAIGIRRLYNGVNPWDLEQARKRLEWL